MPSTGVDPFRSAPAAAEYGGMERWLQRGLPAGGPLALAGAGLAVVALGLPWLSEAVQGDGAMLGYQDQVVWVALRVAVAVAVVVLTLRVATIEHERETLRVVYAGAAVVVALRTVHWLIVTASASEIALPGLAPIPVQGPVWGLFVSLPAAGLLVAASLAQHRLPEGGTSSASASEAETADAAETPSSAVVLEPDLAAFAAPGPVAPMPPSAPIAPAAPAPTAPTAPVAPAPLAGAQRRSVAPPGFS